MRPPIVYGPGLPDDDELRLCGDVAGKRVVELGARGGAAVAFAVRGARAIVLDPSADALQAVRERAIQMSEGDDEVRVQCHQGDLGDLGFATSASVDLVFAAGTLGSVDDLPRILRQVHRVLRPDAPLVASFTHPFAATVEGDTVVRGYGTTARTVSDLFMALSRADFQVDQMVEPDVVGRLSGPSALPPMLVMRARKLGV